MVHNLGTKQKNTKKYEFTFSCMVFVVGINRKWFTIWEQSKNIQKNTSLLIFCMVFVVGIIFDIICSNKKQAMFSSSRILRCSYHQLKQIHFWTFSFLLWIIFILQLFSLVFFCTVWHIQLGRFGNNTPTENDVSNSKKQTNQLILEPTVD